MKKKEIISLKILLKITLNIKGCCLDKETASALSFMVVLWLTSMSSPINKSIF